MSAPLTGTRILAMFAAFFGTVAAADAVLVTSALRTWSGLDEASPYQASQRYNAELGRARAQDGLGWSLDAAASRLPEGGTAIAATLAARDGLPLAGRAVRARLERPTDKREDRAVDLAEGRPGAYAVRTAAVPPGQWDLVVEVMGEDGVAFRRRHRLFLD